MINAHELSTLSPVPHSISRVYSILQRLRSLRHGFWYAVSRRIGWSRGVFRESPAGVLPALSPEASQRIAALQVRYHVDFASRMTAATAINNYEYLDILDRAWSQAAIARPCGKIVCDVGCASFWYAPALSAFFSPRALIGYEIEGHRLFKDGRTRIDYAQGYLTDLPNAQFIVDDYVRCRTQADVITAWFPFVTPAAILAWRLPLSLLAPDRLLARICHNLSPDGIFVMVNHGPKEVEIAAALCAAAGMRCEFTLSEPGALSGHRGKPALLSGWRVYTTG